MSFIKPLVQSYYIGEVVIGPRDGEYQPVLINQTFTNEPVNLYHVIYFFKGEHSFRGGQINLPQLIFVTATKDNNVAWTYETVEQRDAAYQHLLEDYCNTVPPKSSV